MPLTTTIDPEFAFQNLVEAGFWCSLGLGFLVAALAKPRHRARLLAVALTLVVFGASDVAESRTGAWWRPWWLLVWKAACVILLAGFFWRHYRDQRRSRLKNG